MGRIKQIILFTLIAMTAISVQAEKTEEFKKQLKYYQETYSFISMKDTVFTFESEFIIPENYHKVDSSQLSPFSNWISNFPIWHHTKSVGKLGRAKLFNYDKVSRVVHLPWSGDTHTDYGIPIRILAEYLLYTKQDNKLLIMPAKGDSISYQNWLTGKISTSYRKGLFLIPGEKRKPNLKEYYRYLSHLTHHSNFNGLIKICTPIARDETAPGDMYIATDKNGNKGNVYFIMNMIENDSGNKLFIIATGCEKSCDFYIPLFNDDRQNPWITLSEIKKLSEFTVGSGFYRLNNK